MALFTDGVANGVEELLAYDSTVLEAARIEGIDLAVKLRLAWEELGIDLARQLVLLGKADLDLRNVVVTDPLKKCHAFRSLALAYREAAHQQRNDRYQDRWKAWEKKATWAWQALLDTGVAIVHKPLARPNPPAVELIQGDAPAASYCVQMAWLGSKGEESAPSESLFISTSPGQTLRVVPEQPPPEATGWNVYVGHAGSESRRQNSTPLQIHQVWLQPGGYLANGPKPGTGQLPDYYLRRAASPGCHGSGLWSHTPGLLWRG